MKLKIYLLAGILLSGGSQAHAEMGRCGDNVYWYFADSVLTVYGQGDFYDRTYEYLNNQIKSVVIKEGVIAMRADVFADFPSLTSLTLPKSFLFIGNRAFFNCPNFTTVITLNPLPPVIPYWEAFENYASITAYVPFGSVEAYRSEGVWDMCRLVESDSLFFQLYAQSGKFGDRVYWSLVDSVLTVSGQGDMSDNGYNLSREITFSDGHWYACRHGIKTVIIEEGVTSIGNAAFYDCTSLTSVVIPSTCCFINPLSFMGCSSLVEVINKASESTAITYEESSVNLNSFYGLDLTKMTLYVHPESVNHYNMVYGWTNFGYITELNSNYEALQSLAVSAGAFSPAFNPNTLSYHVTVPDSVTKITVTHSAKYGEATVTGAEVKTLNAGDNSFEIIVRAKGSITTRTYSITVRRLSNNAVLQSLAVSPGWLVPEFHPDTLVYRDTVPYSVKEITVTPSTRHSGATVSGGGSRQLSDGWNKIDIRVEAEDITITRTYRVEIYRISSDATLKSLQLAPDNPVDFHPDTLEYKVSVPYSTGAVTVLAEKNDPHASVSGNHTGIKELNVGENTFEITVTAETGIHTKTYTLKVYRQGTTLKSLAVASTGQTAVVLSPPFSSGVLNYTGTVPNSVTDITINALSSDAAASVTGAGHKSLNAGINTFNITVTDKVYTVSVYRQSSDATLKSLWISHAVMFPAFDADVDSYTAVLPYRTDSVTLNATPAHTGATVQGTGRKLLKPGENVFSITVTAEDSIFKKTYTVGMTGDNLSTGFHVAGEQPVRIYSDNTLLHIDSPVAERVNVYSVAGTLLYSFDKPAGAFTLHPSPFTFHPSPVLIVKGSSGWVKKISD